MLVKDTTRTSQAMVSKVARGVLEEMIFKTFTFLVLKGKTQTAVRFVTLRGAGDLLTPIDTNSKSGRPVIDMLLKKLPLPIVPDIKVLEHYDVVPEFIPLDVSEDNVEIIYGQLIGAAGPGGINTAGLQQWLLRLSVAS